MSHEDLTNPLDLLKTFLFLMSTVGIIAGIFYTATHSNFFSSEAATTIIATTASTRLSSLEDGLVGHWTFDGDTTSSTTATDASGNGNNGTLTNNPTPAAGMIGQGLSFDGSDDYLSVANSSSLQFSGAVPITLSAWVNPAQNTAFGTFFVKGRDSDNNAANYAFRHSSTGKKLEFYFNDSGSVNYQIWSSTSDVFTSANTWYHVAVTYTFGTAGSIVAYVNGLPVAGSWTTGTGNVTADVDTQRLTFGKKVNTSGGVEAFSGKLDDARIYNRALSSDEIWRLYTMGEGVKINSADSQSDPLTKGLVGYWKLDDGSGTNAIDSSGNGNTGTLTNGPTWTSGKVMQAIDFTGGVSNQYVSVPNNPILNPSTLTTSVWLKPGVTTQVAWSGIVNKRAASSPPYNNWTLDAGSTGQLLNFCISNNAGGGPTNGQWCLSTGVSDTEWKHVVGTYNGSTQSLYVNGVLVSSQSVSITLANSSNPVRIGWSGDSSGANINQSFDGIIDEVRIYNRALTADEVSRLYRTTDPNDPDTSLVGHWTFDGPDVSGITAYDRSGKGNNGTLTGGTAKAAGTLGQALFFDNTDDYVTIADNTALDFTTSADFTLSGWFRRETYTTDDTLIAKRNGIANTDDGYIAYIDDADDKFYFEVSDIADTDEYSLVSTRTFTDNEWHHYSVTWDDDTANNINLYIDGSYETTVKTGTLANIGDLSTSLAFRVGAESDNGNPFAGKLDDVRVYNRALTATEVYQLYSRQVSYERSCGTVTDRDGNIYGTVKIDTQCWMAQNMRVGTRVGIATTQTNNATIEKWCYSDSDANCTSNNPNQPDGGLYQWDEAMGYSTTPGAQGICPTGFHIPTDAEQYTLENYLKNTGQTCNASRSGAYDCSPAGTKIKPNGTSGLEFNLAGLGFSGSFSNRGAYGDIWSSSESGGLPWFRYVYSGEAKVFRIAADPILGLSVRCLQD